MTVKDPLHGRSHFAKAVPEPHFQFGLLRGKHADASEALRDAMGAMLAGAQTVYCGDIPRHAVVLA